MGKHEKMKAMPEAKSAEETGSLHEDTDPKTALTAGTLPETSPIELAKIETAPMDVPKMEFGSIEAPHIAPQPPVLDCATAQHDAESCAGAAAAEGAEENSAPRLNRFTL